MAEDLRERERWESGEVGAELGEGLARYLFGIESSEQVLARTKGAMPMAENYLSFLPDLFEQGMSYVQTGDEDIGPFSLEELSRRQQEREDLGQWSDVALSGHGGYELPARRRRRRRGCAPGYKRVSSCRCRCKPSRRRARNTRRHGRRRLGRMPAALRRYWSKHRR